MKKPNPNLFLGCPAELRQYIRWLECENKGAIAHIEQLHKRHDELIAHVRDLQCDNTERQTPTKLDQFAMASVVVAHQQVQELRPETIREITGAVNRSALITGEQVRQAVAITAYMMAEAMQAESRKRQGGEA